MDLMERFSIRLMNEKDLKAVMEIDKQVLGETRPDYWKMKFEASKGSGIAPLVAEEKGKVVGFVIGYASGWEYGVPSDTGWIDTIGVHPKYQKKGIGTILVREMIENLKKLGVKRIYTLVNWREWNLLKFFDSLGFRPGDMLNLELKAE